MSGILDKSSSFEYGLLSDDSVKHSVGSAESSASSAGTDLDVCKPCTQKKDSCGHCGTDKCLCVRPSDLLDQRPLCAGERPPLKLKCRKDGDLCGEPKIIATSEITICEQIVPPECRDAPHLVFPRVKCCDKEKCPSAPIVVDAGAPASFVFEDLAFTPLAGAIDTNCRGELSFVSIAPAGVHEGGINYGSDLFVVPISGTLIVNVNCVSYTLAAGGFAYVKAGSPFTITNPSPDTPVTFLLGYLGPGGLGRFRESASYQTAVGGASNLDPCVLESIAAKYCTFPAPNTSQCVNGDWIFLPPGTVRFLPRPVKACCDGSWGLKCCQLLVLATTIPEPLPVGQRAKPAATIAPDDLSGVIVVPTMVPTTVSLQASVIRDPRCGTADVVATPTINGESTYSIVTGTSYYVFFDLCKNDVCITPVPGPCQGATWNHLLRVV